MRAQRVPRITLEFTMGRSRCGHRPWRVPGWAQSFARNAGRPPLDLFGSLRPVWFV